MASHHDSLSAVTPATILITKFCRSRQKLRRLDALYASLRSHERDTGDLFNVLAQERMCIRHLIEQMVLAMAAELPEFYNIAELTATLSRPYVEPRLNKEELTLFYFFVFFHKDRPKSSLVLRLRAADRCPYPDAAHPRCGVFGGIRELIVSFVFSNQGYA